MSIEARTRIMREINTLAVARTVYSQCESFVDEIHYEIIRVFGDAVESNESIPTEHFLSLVEIAVNIIWKRRRKPEDIAIFQSVLADDLSAYRLRDIGDGFQVFLVDNKHLHTEIVDRTFELTRIVEFESAQRDYAQAWMHFSRGDLGDALVNAQKSFESAAKVIIKRVDPNSTPENLQTSQLVPLLVQNDIIPQRLNHMTTQLVQMFQNSGTLRNAPGSGHGSIDLASAEASAALLGLRMTGTFVCFLAERWEQLRPPTRRRAQR
ncbi:MAG: hypothetical protein WKG01_10870 [Kofleriaceae bacterium]